MADHASYQSLVLRAVGKKMGVDSPETPGELDFGQISCDLLDFGDKTFEEWQSPGDDFNLTDAALAAGLLTDVVVA